MTFNNCRLTQWYSFLLIAETPAVALVQTRDPWINRKGGDGRRWPGWAVCTRLWQIPRWICLSVPLFCRSASLCQVIWEDVIIANVSATLLLGGQPKNKFLRLFIHQKQSINASDAVTCPLRQNVTDLMCNCSLSPLPCQMWPGSICDLL